MEIKNGCEYVETFWDFYPVFVGSIRTVRRLLQPVGSTLVLVELCCLY